MKINTSRFGEIQAQESDLISIPKGLIGFAHLTQFVVFDDAEHSSFKWLQSTQDAAIAFLIVNPNAFYSDYAVELSENELSELSLTHPNDGAVAVIVTVANDPHKISANLKAPLVFHLNMRVGKQVVLRDSSYQTRHLMAQETKKQGMILG